MPSIPPPNPEDAANSLPDLKDAPRPAFASRSLASPNRIPRGRRAERHAFQKLYLHKIADSEYLTETGQRVTLCAGK
jgi:hypothetical protein